MNKKTSQKLSYESDGKMGKENHKKKSTKNDEGNFFNMTQNSE
ncbi:hypothetical protein [Bacillus timonensis]|nr:hypothetical protein [Bacillus timonensis]